MSKKNYTEMKKIGMKLWRCPICLGKKTDKDYPAISRKDNETEICSYCGTKEALEDFNNYKKSKLDLSYRASDSLLIASNELIEAGHITEMSELQYFFEKPQKYKEELEELGFEVQTE